MKTVFHAIAIGLAVTFCSGGFCRAPANAAGETPPGDASGVEGQMPLDLIARTSIGPRDLDSGFPFVTIGALPANTRMAPLPHYSLELDPFPLQNQVRGTLDPDYLARAELLQDISWGRVNLHPMSANEPAVLLLEGPTLSSGMKWEPVSLSRSGPNYTITVEEWTDDLPRFRNAITRSLYLLSIGPLAAGDHRVRLDINRLFKDGARDQYYHFNGSSFGDVSFSVPGLDAGHSVALLPSISGDHMSAARQVPVAGTGPGFQQIDPVLRELTLPIAVGDDTAHHGLSVGTFDKAKWKGIGKTTLPYEERPALVKPTATGPVYVSVIGPYLNEGEWMTVQSVEWAGKTATVHVEIWRDNADDFKKSIVFLPLALVKLDLPLSRSADGALKIDPGDYTVKLDAAVLRAPTAGGIYQPHPGDKGGFLDADQTTATFTIP